MKKEEYPEKIFILHIPSTQMFNEHFICTEDEGVKYTRSDLVPKWHKYPDEKPTKNCEYNVTISYTNGQKDVVTALWSEWSDKWIFGRDMFGTEQDVKEVLAWMEKPQPYKEN